MIFHYWCISWVHRRTNLRGFPGSVYLQKGGSEAARGKTFFFFSSADLLQANQVNSSENQSPKSIFPLLSAKDCTEQLTTPVSPSLPGAHNSPEQWMQAIWVGVGQTTSQMRQSKWMRRWIYMTRSLHSFTSVGSTGFSCRAAGRCHLCIFRFLDLIWWQS